MTAKARSRVDALKADGDFFAAGQAAYRAGLTFQDYGVHPSDAREDEAAARLWFSRGYADALESATGVRWKPETGT